MKIVFIDQKTNAPVKNQDRYFVDRDGEVICVEQMDGCGVPVYADNVTCVFIQE